MGPGLSRAEELRQLKRKRHNAALTTLGATTGAVGTGTYAGSLLAKNPTLRRRLGSVSLGTAIAGGGIGAIGGFRGASAARRDIHARERQLNVAKIDTTMDEHTARRYTHKYGTRGPLPANLDRSEKMRAYEGRYVALGGPKGEKWKRRSQRADKVTGGAVITGGLGAAGQLASETKVGQRALRRIKREPARVGHVSGRVALGAAALGAGSEYAHRHAERRQASYSHSPAGVAASALRRMRDYTP